MAWIQLISLACLTRLVRLTYYCIVLFHYSMLSISSMTFDDLWLIFFSIFLPFVISSILSVTVLELDMLE